MVKRRWMLLAALAIPLVAWGQSPVQDGQRFSPVSESGARSTMLQGAAVGGVIRADSTFKMLTVDSDGNLKTVNADPIQDQFRDGSVAIISSSIAALSADSSAVISMGAYRLMGLAIRMTGNPSLHARLAVQIRFHLNAQSDTSSMFPIQGLQVPGATTVTQVDSIPWASVVAPTTTVLSRSEFQVNLVNDGLGTASFGSAPNAYILLRDKSGQGIWAPYISVRVRVLSVTTALAAGLPIRVYLTATPL